MTFRKTITRGGEPWGEPVGEAIYYPGWRDTPAYCVSKEFPSGMIRKVFTDKDGRALMTGWFFPEAYEV
ncbi:hypothetical protein [Streptomyces globisporus]|uniref:hypothetical protein n=1 Tax=Streptomyces globisporus TaxID=1908 RepID=UPI0036B7708B